MPDDICKDALIGAKKELVSANISEDTYREVLEQAWADFQISEDERKLVEVLRKKLGISDEKHNEFEYNICERLGEAQLQNGNNESAIKFFERMCQLMPNKKDAWARTGRIYISLGNIENAKKCIEKALEIDSTDDELASLLNSCNKELAEKNTSEKKIPKIVDNKYENTDSKIDKRLLLLTPWEIQRKGEKRKKIIDISKNEEKKDPEKQSISQPLEETPQKTENNQISKNNQITNSQNPQHTQYGATQTPPQAYLCKSCGSTLTYIYQYKRWYCPKCRNYL